MSDLSPLPPGYVAFDELNFCSNVFRNVAIPLAINAYPLVLVGRGTLPLVWLAAPAQPNSSTWAYVVKKSLAASPGINIEWSKPNRALSIAVDSTSIMIVEMASFQHASVTLLDLRPLGLDVVGTKTGLTIGTNQFKGNAMVGARIGLNLTVPGAALLPT